MAPPRDWCPPQGERVPSGAHWPLRRSQHQSDRLEPWPAWELADGLLPMPRWKRFVLMYVRPVCMAMVWQLGVVIGLLMVCVLGLTLIKLLRL